MILNNVLAKKWDGKIGNIVKMLKDFLLKFWFYFKGDISLFHHCVLWCARPQTLVEKQKEIDFHCWCYPCSDWNGRANEMEFSTTTTVAKNTKKESSGSTGCPNKFGIHSEMFASEARYVYKKIVFRSKKLLFQPFFLNCKTENGFLKQLFSIY